MIDLSIPEIKNFVDYVKKECKREGVKIVLKRAKNLKLSENMKCSGYFDGEDKVLAVAAKHPMALEVLVHEFCHFTQWIENTPEWQAADVSLNYVEDWLEGKRVKNIKKWLGLSRDLELDNEKRTVAMIKRFKLPIDTKEYTKKANAYVLFYNWMFFSRRWCTPKNTPYRNNVILEACSNKFNMRYDELSESMRAAFLASGI